MKPPPPPLPVPAAKESARKARGAALSSRWLEYLNRKDPGFQSMLQQRTKYLPPEPPAPTVEELLARFAKGQHLSLAELAMQFREEEDFWIAHAREKREVERLKRQASHDRKFGTECGCPTLWEHAERFRPELFPLR